MAPDKVKELTSDKFKQKLRGQEQPLDQLKRILQLKQAESAICNLKRMY
jgi:hypothetical protein